MLMCMCVTPYALTCDVLREPRRQVRPVDGVKNYKDIITSIDQISSDINIVICACASQHMHRPVMSSGSHGVRCILKRGGKNYKDAITSIDSISSDINTVVC